MLGGKQIKCSWGRHPNTPPQSVQSSLMALAAATGVALPVGPAPPHLPSPGGVLPGSMSSPQPLHLGPPHHMHHPLGIPMASSATQSIIQGQVGGGGGGGLV